MCRPILNNATGNGRYLLRTLQGNQVTLASTEPGTKQVLSNWDSDLPTANMPLSSPMETRTTGHGDGGQDLRDHQTTALLTAQVLACAWHPASSGWFSPSKLF